MSASPLPSTDGTIYAVREWKETLDQDAPWWQKWYHRFVYRPFNEFSLRVMRIPPDNYVVLDGNRVTFSLVEDGGFFSSEHEADIACLTERYSYQGMPFGRAFPDRSGQCLGPTIFPRAKEPRKRAKPILSLIFKDRKQEESEQKELARYIRKLNQVLDQ